MSTWEIGKIGEGLVENYLEKSGYLFYRAPSKRHPIDWFLTNSKKDLVRLADAKTKPRRIAYPDTGINYDHYCQYKYLQDRYSVDVLLVFVDPAMRKIYGNLLSILTKQFKVNNIQYPLRQTTQKGIEIIYFPLVSMTPIDDISEAHADEINRLSNRRYEYNSSLTFNFVIQPSLLDIPYTPKPSRRKKYKHENPAFLKQILLLKTCKCGQDHPNPRLHSFNCEYRQELLKDEDDD